MKKQLLLIVLIVFRSSGFSQQFSIHAGAGIGGSFEKKFEGCAKKDAGRITGYIALSYQAGNHYSIGIEAMSSGRLFSLIGGSGYCSGSYNATTNTEQLNYNNLETGMILFQNKYIFTTLAKLQPYIAMGIGISTAYCNVQIDGISRVSKTAFVISPEIGVGINRFTIASKLILGGKTPIAAGFSSFSNTQKVLTGISSQQLYITTGYRIWRF